MKMIRKLSLFGHLAIENIFVIITDFKLEKIVILSCCELLLFGFHIVIILFISRLNYVRKGLPAYFVVHYCHWGLSYL